MAPSTGAKLSVRSGLYLGVACHVGHLMLVLMLIASVMMTWLEAAKLTLGFQGPWDISPPSVCKGGLQTAMDKINSELEISARSLLTPTQPVVPRSLLLFTSARSRKKRFLSCLDQHDQKPQK